MGIIAAGVAIIGFCTPFIVSSRFTVDATPTPLGKLTIVKQSPALNELKNMNVQVSNSQIHAKVSAEEIINQLAQKQYFSEQKATTIEATYYVISRVPKELVNPNVISSDPVIKVSGDYLYNIPVWVIRFNGVHPPMSTGLGIHHSSPKQQAVDTVFDATTGKVIIGFSS
ncbi:hypothetical protein AAC03nite_34610 [Alicyclobacillus acidoterrestris]|nr:hypothetical protein AAC03nite_34610 [Alicyclobacillus acidoterrestris]